jgi:hypothetical protein
MVSYFRVFQGLFCWGWGAKRDFGELTWSGVIGGSEGRSRVTVDSGVAGWRGDRERFWSFGGGFGCKTELLQQRAELVLLGLRQGRGDGVDVAGVTLVEVIDESAACGGEVYDAGAPVGFAVSAKHPAFLFEAVDGGRHRGIREQDLFTDGGDGHGALVQEDFEDHEVAEAQALGCDAGLHIGGERAVGAGKDDPKAGACGCGGGFRRSGHAAC